MARVHRVTHPVLGLASWEQIRKASAKLRLSEARSVCHWCFGLVAKPARTQCSELCGTMINRAIFYQDVVAFVLHRDELICQLCFSDERCGAPQVDHIIPVSLGGSGDIENLRTLCKRCHDEETSRLRREGVEFIARTARNAGAIPN